MTSFTLNAVPEIAAGPDRIDGLGRDVAALADGRARVLLVADPGLEPFGLSERARAALEAGGHAVEVFDALRSDPTEVQVAAGIAQAVRFGARAVVALGGGSAIDAGKLVAVLAGSDRPVTDYRLAATPLPRRRLPLLAVPTTAGTGAETTSTSVLSDAKGVKYWYWGAPIRPDRVVLDPTLTTALPPGLTAASGIDALVHAIEALTNRNAFPANRRTGLEAVRLVNIYLPGAVAHPDDLEARGAMLLAACLAGTAIDNAGTAIAHNIAHALAGLLPIHHGRAVAIGMAASFEWNVGYAPDIYQPVAEAMGLTYASELPEHFAQLVRAVAVDPTLDGVDAARLAEAMLAPANAPMLAANIRQPEPGDVERLAARVVALP